MKAWKKIIALVLVLTMLVQPLASVAATTTSSKPSDGTTTNAPFPKGTAGSNSFRIPSLVTLSDGTLVAAADARWNTTYDGGGLDTIVSRSSDNGKNWNYTFANYLGDNGNTYNGRSSTCFIDPAMAVTSDDTIYMLVDLYPYGVALNGDGSQTAPLKNVGFDSNGRLLLSNNNHSSYDYYLDNGKIYSTSETEVEGYTVDAYFNIKGTNGKDSNLFFEDSPFKVVRTGYHYLTKSTDKGATWSAPTLLNLKTSSEQVCLVGPGRGLVTSSGMIVFPVYSFHGDNEPSSNTQRMSFIYSEDEGKTWKRTSEFDNNWASESAVVELTDGTLRFFYRNGTKNLCYVDYSNDAWGTAVNTGVVTNSNCQISAITYSKTIDGKQVILVSCPAGAAGGSNQSSASARLNGKIFVGLVNSDKTISWQTDKTINVASKNSDAYFMYSCLTELKDASIAILYEDNESNWGSGNNSYYQMSFETYEAFDTENSGDNSNGSSDGDVNDAPANEPETTYKKDVTLGIGEETTITDESGNYEGAENNSLGDESIAIVEVTGTTVSGEPKETPVTSVKSGIAYYIKSSTGKYLAADASWVYSISKAVAWTYTNDGLRYGDIWLNCTETSYQQYSLNTSSSKSTTWSTSDGVFSCTFSRYIIQTYTLGSAYSLTTTEPKSETKIAITGVKPGTTKAIVGDTTYNITVNKKQDSAKIVVGSEATFNEAGTKIEKNANPNVATAKLNAGNLIITAKAEGTTVITTDYGIYTITVTEGTPISIKKTETKELSVDLKDGQYVEWSTTDSQYVGVAGKYDASANKYTNTGVIIGHTVTENPVVVTGTIYNSDGTVAGTQKWLVTVTEGDKDINQSSRYIYANVTAIEHCTVYYSINGGELVELNGTGVLVDEKISGHYNIMFFAAPDEGYALTYMNVTGSGQQYYTLSDGNPDGTGSGAWPFKSDVASSIPSTSGDSAWKSGHGFRWSLLEGNMSIEQMKLMFSNAIALGCDGATTFTKNGTDSFYTELQFAAQKLPTMEKEIVSITRRNGTTETYSDGMKVEIGDTINYKIYIQEYAEVTGPIWNGKSYTTTSPITSTNKPTYNTGSYGTITYSKESLKDELTEGNWTPDLGTSSTKDEKYTQDTSLKLTKDNFKKVVTDGKIVNTADFHYTYTSNYSEGTLDAKASAVAEITVEVPSYVIDFGLPTTFDLRELVAAYGKIQGATAKYGTVSVNGSAVTYTPTETLKGVDYINLDLENGDYAVAVYPATTVYYEEGFATGSSGDWATISKDTTLSQAAEKVGAKSNVYGFDSAYSKVEASNASSATSNQASVASFTFTGTGVDIYTNNTTSSGVLMAWVKNAAGKTVKVIQVDTHMQDGTTAGTTGQSVNAYNVPVVSLTGLERATYTVELRHIGQSKKAEDGTTSVVFNPVSLDGFRVHGTIDENTTAYVTDEEDNPTFIELRDKVLAGLNVQPEKSTYAKDIAKDVLAQVYATQENSEGAVVVSSYGKTSNSKYDVQDLLDNGPKNELYLRKGESVVFKVKTDRVTQIGLKALDKELTSISIKADGTTIFGAPTALNTSTDMFYKLADKKGSKTEVTYTITNNSDGILSITELKICDDPSATFCELTEEDLVPALVGLGFEPEVQYADAKEEIHLVDYAGNVVASTVLTQSGKEGTEAEFTADALKTAANEVLPEGYAFVDIDQLKGQTVNYGESGQVTVQVGKTAILEITYKKLFGKKVGTATLIGIQTGEATKYSFKAADIRNAVPEGYRAIKLIDMKVSFGTTGKTTVYVY